MNTTTRTLAQLFATGAALAAIAAGSASAGTHPNDRPGAQGTGAAALAQATPDWFERAAQRATDESSLVAAPIVRTPDWFERAAIRANEAPLPVPVAKVAGTDERGFRWEYAIAGTAVLLLLTVAGVVLAAQQRGRAGRAILD